MKEWQRWILVTIAVGLVSFLVTPAIWPYPPNIHPGAYLPLFVLLNVFESLAFGLGVAFLAFGLPQVARSEGSRALNVAAYLSTAWFLVNWWPHDNLHKLVQFKIAPLLGLEYGFHVTLMAAGAVLALYVWRAIARGEMAAHRQKPSGDVDTPVDEAATPPLSKA